VRFIEYMENIHADSKIRGLMVKRFLVQLNRDIELKRLVE